MDRIGADCECVADHIEASYEECEKWKIPELLPHGWTFWEEIEKKLAELRSPQCAP
jgi:hypothetical protein